jgi:hypothetical protein
LSGTVQHPGSTSPTQRLVEPAITPDHPIRSLITGPGIAVLSGAEQDRDPGDRGGLIKGRAVAGCSQVVRSVSKAV